MQQPPVLIILCILCIDVEWMVLLDGSAPLRRAGSGLTGAPTTPGELRATVPIAASTRRKTLRPEPGSPRRPHRPERGWQFFSGSETPAAVGRHRFPAWPPCPPRLHERTRDNRADRAERHCSERLLHPRARCSHTRRPYRKKGSTGAPDWPGRLLLLSIELWSETTWGKGRELSWVVGNEERRGGPAGRPGPDRLLKKTRT